MVLGTFKIEDTSTFEASVNSYGPIRLRGPKYRNAVRSSKPCREIALYEILPVGFIVWKTG